MCDLWAYDLCEPCVMCGLSVHPCHNLCAMCDVLCMLPTGVHGPVLCVVAQPDAPSTTPYPPPCAGHPVGRCGIVGGGAAALAGVGLLA